MNDLLSFIPAGYAKYLVLVPFITRAYYSLKTGGGIIGVWRSIMFGTNAPKETPKP